MSISITPETVVPVIMAAHGRSPRRDVSVIAALSAALECATYGAGCGRHEVMVDAVAALDSNGGRFGLTAAELAEYERLTSWPLSRLTSAEIARASELRAKSDRWHRAQLGASR